MNRRALLAALAALPFVRPAEAATVPDIHVLNPDALSVTEVEGVIKIASVVFRDPNHADLRGKTYGFYGTPLAATQQQSDPHGSFVFFEEINL